MRIRKPLKFQVPRQSGLNRSVSRATMTDSFPQPARLEPRVRPITEGRIFRLLTATECHPFLLFKVNLHRRELCPQYGIHRKTVAFSIDRIDINRKCLNPLR